MKLKIAYFGTPYFSANLLEKLITDDSINQLIEVKFVVTQPDKKVGRKQIITPSSIKEMAKKYNIETIDDFKKLQVTSYKLQEVDLALIYFYGQIIPEEILRLPKYGFWNIHFSALPKYRGPAPVVYSLIMGDQETAVSFVQTDTKLDHGDIIAQQPVTINPQETRIELEERLHNVSFEMFKKLVNSLIREPNNKLILTKQNHTRATYTRFTTKQDGYIPLDVLKKASNNKPLAFEELPMIIKDYLIKHSISPNYYLLATNYLILNMFHAFNPWPGIWTFIRENRIIQKRLKITNLDIIHNKLVIKKIQLEGKKEVDFNTFNAAYKIF